MGKIIFIIGGARSGKSDYAVKLASEISQKVAFFPTCKPQDNEMKKRITLHRKNRPSYWKTFECFDGETSLLRKSCLRFDVILIDCLTLMISNLMLKGIREDVVKNRINRILNILKKGKATAIIVSNEVGLGIVPENKLARDFRDIAGKINQLTAKNADEVYFMVSGLPLKLK